MSEIAIDDKPNNEKNMADALREKARTSKRVAWLLDECIQIPGTKIKFGLDPIIGMIPGAGDFTSTLIGAAVLTEAGKKGIPFSTLFKMGGNMMVNALGGLLPGLGDFFSVWFKSNKRNYELLKDFVDAEDGEEVRGGWGPLIFALFIIGVIICVNLAVVIVVGWAALQLVDKLGLTPAEGATDAVPKSGY